MEPVFTENFNDFRIFIFVLSLIGARGSLVVKALCYKPDDRGFDTR
jgi:hypothetical protein